MTQIRPQPGFQTQALACSADIAILGGAAGCGKSWCSMVMPLAHIGNPGFNAIIFRRTYPELVGGGSIWEESLGLYSALGGIPRHSDHTWRFPSGATLKMSHLQRDHDRLTHQGKAYALIIFEELTHFTETQWTYLMSRSRSVGFSRPYIRATCNPDSDSFVAKWVDWWIDERGYPIPERSGVVRWFARDDDNVIWGDSAEEVQAALPDSLPKSFTFISGSLEDNRILLDANPQYRANLQALPLVERERLLFGNWRIKPAAGLFFRESYFPIVDSVDPDKVKRTVRFWDKAATEATKGKDPSWTVGLKMALLDDGSYCVLDVIRLRGTPATVDKEMWNAAQRDGEDVKIGLFQDPGQAGVVDVSHSKRVLQGFTVRPFKVTKSKIQMAGPVSSQAEIGNIKLVRAKWNESFLNELVSFPESAHDDQVDALSGCYQQLLKKSVVFI